MAIKGQLLLLFICYYYAIFIIITTVLLSLESHSTASVPSASVGSVEVAPWCKNVKAVIEDVSLGLTSSMGSYSLGWEGVIKFGPKALDHVRALARFPKGEAIAAHLRSIQLGTDVTVNQERSATFAIPSSVSKANDWEGLIREFDQSREQADNTAEGQAVWSMDKRLAEKFIGQPLVLEKFTQFVRDHESGFYAGVGNKPAR